jgi:hypothetical protein
MSDSSCSRQWINDESGVKLTEAICIQTCPNKQNEAQVLRKRETIQSCFRDVTGIDLNIDNATIVK